MVDRNELRLGKALDQQFYDPNDPRVIAAQGMLNQVGTATPAVGTVYFERAMKMIYEMHHKKAADYTSNGEFDNFIESAEDAGVSTEQSIEVLIGTKQSRLKSLRNRPPVNESKFDTYFDRAVYCIIAMAYQLMLQDQQTKTAR